MAVADKIRILIADDDEEVRAGVARLLEIEDEGRMQVVGFADNGKSAVDQAMNLHPDVVLMDINMPIMNGIDATSQITSAAPDIGVIMLTVQDDPVYMQQAFRARAVDYMTKPFTSSELAESINRYISGRQPYMPPPPAPPQPVSGHVVGVLGFKGGTGKTTLAINLAVGLAMARKQVVLVDGDVLFGDVGIALNTRAPRSIVHLARVASEADEIDPEAMEAALVPHEAGLKLLLSPTNPDDAERISSEAMVNLLRFLRQQFEYVIVDTSCRVDEVLVGTVRAADRLIVVSHPSMSSLKDTRLIFRQLSGLEAMHKVTVALNQVDRSDQITPDQIANHLKVDIPIQVPADPTALNALNSGVALITLDPKRSPAIRPLMAMVQVVIGQCETVVEPAPLPRSLPVTSTLRRPVL
jgi:pilus assembly protein CpaE